MARPYFLSSIEIFQCNKTGPTVTHVVMKVISRYFNDVQEKERHNGTDCD